MQCGPRAGMRPVRYLSRRLLHGWWLRRLLHPNTFIPWWFLLREFPGLFWGYSVSQALYVLPRPLLAPLRFSRARRGRTFGLADRIWRRGWTLLVPHRFPRLRHLTGGRCRVQAGFWMGSA